MKKRVFINRHLNRCPYCKFVASKTITPITLILQTSKHDVECMSVCFARKKKGTKNEQVRLLCCLWKRKIWRI